MACTSIQNRLHLLFPQGNFDNLIEQVATVIPSQKPQNYLALFVVFQQEIEAVIREDYGRKIPLDCGIWHPISVLDQAA